MTSNEVRTLRRAMRGAVAEWVHRHLFEHEYGPFSKDDWCTDRKCWDGPEVNEQATKVWHEFMRRWPWVPAKLKSKEDAP